MEAKEERPAEDVMKWSERRKERVRERKGGKL